MDLKGKIHIIGICGIGMSAIALYLKNLGGDISGSDTIVDSSVAKNLRLNGINVMHHGDNNITNSIDFIVKSTAIPNDNIELIRADKLNIKIYTRSDILSEITKQHSNVISISGSHGKTTTTTMTGELFHYLNKDPTIFSGGIMGLFDSNFKQGSDQLMIVEADESDGTFMNLKTDIAVLTNIEFEHAEYYKDLDQLLVYCEKFINASSVQYVIIYGDDPIIQKLEIYKKTIRYGFNNTNDIYAKYINETFTVVVFGKEITNLKLNAYGRHNILNALCALSIAIATYGLTDEILNGALKMMANYKGVARRFNLLANNKGVTIVDDYAHHPTEIRATIATAKELNNRVIAVLQPHRYSRLAALMDEFVLSIAEVDIAIISHLYSAGEEAIDGISSEVLVELMQKRFPHKKIYFRKDKDSIYKLLDEIRLNDDVILFMGAGTITEWAKYYAKE